jgi:hypothetical protein
MEVLQRNGLNLDVMGQDIMRPPILRHGRRLPQPETSTMHAVWRAFGDVLRRVSRLVLVERLRGL